MIRANHEEAEMAVAMIVEDPDGSQETYERVRDLVGPERPVGGICHLAGPSPNGGWRLIEVWESESDAQRFLRERLRPAFEAVGVPGPPPRPEFWPIHAHITQGQEV